MYIEHTVQYSQPVTARFITTISMLVITYVDSTSDTGVLAGRYNTYSVMRESSYSFAAPAEDAPLVALSQSRTATHSLS